MQIKGMEVVTQKPLSEFKPGDIFKETGILYMLTDRKDGGYMYAIRLSDGSLQGYCPSSSMGIAHGYFQETAEEE